MGIINPTTTAYIVAYFDGNGDLSISGSSLNKNGNNVARMGTEVKNPKMADGITNKKLCKTIIWISPD